MASYTQELERPTNPKNDATGVSFDALPPSEIRAFATGATRDTDDGKHDPEGFLSPLVVHRYNEYMHKNRVQKDGSVRTSCNWTRGIPKEAYMKSLWRHFLDVWTHHRNFGYKSKEPLEEALCGVIFNSMGMLYEVLKEKEKQPGPQVR